MDYKCFKYKEIPGTMHCVMKAYTGIEVKLHSSFISAKDGGLYAISHCDHFTPRERCIGFEIW
jgi:hypothetical protein